MSRSLAKKSSSNISNMLIGIVLIGILIYFVVKKNSIGQQYTNKEKWIVEYNPKGLPTTIIIERNAKQNG